MRKPWNSELNLSTSVARPRPNSRWRSAASGASATPRPKAIRLERKESTDSSNTDTTYDDLFQSELSHDTTMTSRPSSISTVKDQRWSEVVPPDTALAFCAIWDPEHGIIGFSSAELDSSTGKEDEESDRGHALSPRSPTLSAYSSEDPSSTYLRSSLKDSYAYRQSRSAQRSAPKSPMDTGRSQVLTVGAWTITASETMAVLAPFESEIQETSLRRGHTQTSSTLGITDVYLRGSMLGRAHSVKRYTCLETLDAWAFEFDTQMEIGKELYKKRLQIPRRVSDEGFFESTAFSKEAQNLCSAFSVTTTSTSRYISVERDTAMESEASSDTWCTLEPPQTPMALGRSPFTGVQQKPQPRRCLTKRRHTHLDTPAPPSQVLNRPHFNHINGPEPHLPLFSLVNATTGVSMKPVTSKVSQKSSKTTRPPLKTAVSCDSGLPRPSQKSCKTSCPSLKTALSCDSALPRFFQRWKQGAPGERWVRIDVDASNRIRQCYVPPPVL